MRELVRRIVFNLACGNADAHLKNWSLIYPDGRTARLSPAYDLVSVVAYSGYEDALGLSLGREKDPTRIGFSAFERLARRTERPADEVQRWVREDSERIWDE